MSIIKAEEVLLCGLKKYGEMALAGKDAEGLLKKHAVTESISAAGVTFRHVKEAIVANGDILEENPEEQWYISAVYTGCMNAVRAITAVVLQEDVLFFAAYAKEGLIRQHLAQKAIDSIKERIS